MKWVDRYFPPEIQNVLLVGAAAMVGLMLASFIVAWYNAPQYPVIP